MKIAYCWLHGDRFQKYGKNQLRKTSCPFPEFGPLTDWNWYAVKDQRKTSAYVLTRVPLPFSVMGSIEEAVTGIIGAMLNRPYTMAELHGTEIDRLPSGNPFDLFGVHVLKVGSCNLRSYRRRSQELVGEKGLEVQ